MRLQKYFCMLGVLACLAVSAGQACSQSDTVHMRVMFSKLTDGTLIKYIGGPYQLRTSSGVKYLSFNSADTSYPNGFLKTKPFRLHSSDTLYFSRLIGFDDADARSTPAHVSDDATDSVAAAWVTYYQGRQFKPDTAYFAPTSTMDYIVEIRRSSDDAVLFHVDTTRILTNANGELRWLNLFQSLNLRRYFFSNVDTDVYLNVRLELHGISSSSLTYSGEWIQNRDSLSLYHFLYSMHHQIYPFPPRAVMAVARRTGSTMSNEQNVDVYPDGYSGKFRVVTSGLPAQIKMLVVNSAGKVVHERMLDDAPAKDIDLGFLPSGGYTLVFSTSTSRIAKHVILVH